MSENDVLERAAEKLAERLAHQMRGIVPERVYPPDEAAELIGIQSTRRGKTIREIPPEMLPAVSVTPGGRIVGYYGRDLIRYVRQQRDRHAPPIEGVA